MENEATCCDPRSACNSTACSLTHVLKADVTDLYCNSSSCSEGGEDEAVCCDARLWRALALTLAV